MFAMAARRLGYRVHTLAPEDDTPTGQIADLEINAPYDDLDAVRAFARGVDVSLLYSNAALSCDATRSGDRPLTAGWPALSTNRRTTGKTL